MAIGDAPSWQDLLGANWQKYADPRTYANSIVNSQYNPVLNQLAMSRSRASILRGQTNASIQQAYAPALAQYKNQIAQDAAAAAGVQHNAQQMAGQLANATGSSGNNAGLVNTASNYSGLVGAMGVAQGNLDRSGLTQAQQRVSQMQSTRQAELQNRMMDIDRALVDTRQQKAGAYTKAFTEGLGMRNQLVAGALANRGAMINQDVLQGMAPEQLKSAKLANKQAAQNLIWQNLQGQQGLQMNNLQMQAMRQQMTAAGLNAKSFFSNTPQTQQQALDGIMQGFIDPNSGGWKNGMDAHGVINGMYKKMAVLFPATAKKNSKKLRAAIQSWVYGTNGINPGNQSTDSNGNVIDPGIGGSYSTGSQGYQQSPGIPDYSSPGWDTGVLR